MNTVIEQLIDNYNPKNSEEVKNAMIPLAALLNYVLKQ